MKGWFRETVGIGLAVLGILVAAGILWFPRDVAGARAGMFARRGVDSPRIFFPQIAKNWSLITDSGPLLITEVLYDPLEGEPEGEWIEIYNPGSQILDLSDHKIGDEEIPGGGEGMFRFPPETLIRPGEVVLIANQAASFASLYGFSPDFELRESDPTVPALTKYTAWSGGNVILLNSSDEVLLLDGQDQIVDAISWGSSTFAFDPPAPDVQAGGSLERVPANRDTDSAADWVKQPLPGPGSLDFSQPTSTPSPTLRATLTRTPAPSPTDGPTGTPTPTATATSTPTPFEGVFLISEVLYDPAGEEPEGEWVELYNPGPESILLDGFKLGDEETPGGSEGMVQFPAGVTLSAGGVIVIANSATAFNSFYGFLPDFELGDSDPLVPEMIRYDSWAGGRVSLGNSGDELLLLDGADRLVDALSWGSSIFAFDPPAPDVRQGASLARLPADQDTDTAADWATQLSPDPGQINRPPSTATPVPSPGSVR